MRGMHDYGVLLVTSDTYSIALILVRKSITVGILLKQKLAIKSHCYQAMTIHSLMISKRRAGP